MCSILALVSEFRLMKMQSGCCIRSMITRIVRKVEFFCLTRKLCVKLYHRTEGKKMAIEGRTSHILNKLDALPSKKFGIFMSELLEKDGIDHLSVSKNNRQQLIGSGTFNTSLIAVRVCVMGLRNVGEVDINRHLEVEAEQEQGQFGLPIKTAISSWHERCRMTNGHRGLLVTTGLYTLDFVDWANRLSDGFIDLVDGPKLCNVCEETSIDVELLEDEEREFEGEEILDVNNNGTIHAVFFGKKHIFSDAIDSYVAAWNALIDMRPSICEELYDDPMFRKRERRALGRPGEGRQLNKKYPTRFKTLKNGWVVGGQYSNDAKRIMIKYATKHANYSFGKGNNIDVGF